MSSTTELDMNLAVAGARATIELVGDLDVAGAGRLRELGSSALSTDGVERLVLDMAGVIFVDSSGLGALIHLRSAAEAEGAVLILSGRSPTVRRVFELAGLARLFED